jgi:hypothetical protein
VELVRARRWPTSAVWNRPKSWEVPSLREVRTFAGVVRARFAPPRSRASHPRRPTVPRADLGPAHRVGRLDPDPLVPGPSCGCGLGDADGKPVGPVAVDHSDAENGEQRGCDLGPRRATTCASLGTGDVCVGFKIEPVAVGPGGRRLPGRRNGVTRPLASRGLVIRTQLRSCRRVRPPRGPSGTGLPPGMTTFTGRS